MLSVNIPELEATICYFSLEPAAFDHFSTETPLYSPTINHTETAANPSNPLLARRDSEILFTPVSPLLSTASTILQMQTAAAHGQSRPRPFPVQNVLHVTSNEWSSIDSSSSGASASTASSSSSSSAIESAKSSLDLARCSRCQRTPSFDVKTGKSNMVQYGMNSWYCNRCAAMVGLTNR